MPPPPVKQVRDLFKADQERYLERIYNKHPNLSGYLKTFYNRKCRDSGYVLANHCIRELSESLTVGGLSVGMDEEQLCNIAEVRAKHCEHIYRTHATHGDVIHIASALAKYCSASGVQFQCSEEHLTNPQRVLPAALRTCNEKWWRRQLRRTYIKKAEGALRGIGVVSKSKSPYISEYSFKRWIQNQRRNAQVIEGMEAVTNIDGVDVSIPLSDCIASSVANPVNRRNELMVRMRGYEEVAAGLGLTGIFLTLTAPSKYHAISAGRGLNPKFAGATPSDTMGYLNGVWARIRSEWARSGIRCFGFRVAEPHHDGTPHFHFMLFLTPKDLPKALHAFGQHALAEDPNEPGAEKYRWDFKQIDPDKGTASAYIAKYVAKNIDGASMDVDHESDCNAGEGALRARAWASLWGIRQFQQIGCISVTVYRELRRKAEAFELLDSDIEAIRSAADAGDWAKFVELMGGPLAVRSEQTLLPNYEEKSELNEYCEPVKRIVGLTLNVVGRAMARRDIRTRDHVWKVQRCKPELNQEEAPPPPLDL